MFRASRQADLSGNLCYIADGISGLVWRNVTRVWRGTLSTQLFRGCWWNFWRVETKARRDQNESSARGIRDAVSACKWIIPRPPSFSFSSISQPLWINLIETFVTGIIEWIARVKKIDILWNCGCAKKFKQQPLSRSSNLISKGDKCDSLNRWKGFISSDHPLEV